MRYFSPLLAVVLFATATAAQATVHRVYPGDSIQIAIDGASPGDTILVEPGIYNNENPNSRFGLHITTDNLRLIGKVKKGRGEAGKVILTPAAPPVEGGGVQQTGVYAAPATCTPEDEVGDEFCEGNRLKGFYIRGFTVHGYEWNGIQTRFVNDFKIIRNETFDLDRNGIYPTISANGLVQNNVSYGTMDTSMWVAASENVRVIGNDLSGSPIGLEVNVSVDIEVMHNDIHDNSVGIALFHPNSAGNKPRDDMGNWVVTHNNVYDNNIDNPAPPTTFQGRLPPGIGILLLGVSDNVVAKNTVENNDFVGIGVLGWCSATSTTPDNCKAKPAITDPSVNNNLVSQNKVRDNGLNPPKDPPFDVIDFLAADLTYFSIPFVIIDDEPFPTGETSSGNCFKKNKPKGYSVSAVFEPEGKLPTDGC
jgi:nitrous oxidase accessory protein NosD